MRDTEISSGVPRGFLPYRLNESPPHSFYFSLARFTDEVLDRNGGIIFPLASSLRAFVADNAIESPRTGHEYALDLLIAGVLVRNYLPSALQSSRAATRLLRFLYSLRSRNRALKTAADRIRGLLSRRLLHAEGGGISARDIPSFNDMKALNRWLLATGEFNEEARRLSVIIAWIKSMNRAVTDSTFRSVSEFTESFMNLADEHLGLYTRNVSSFRDRAFDAYRHREDFIFVNRRENEYHMNMFGAEILNRQMRDAFVSKRQKAVLVPTCMRSFPTSGCRAASDGRELVCARCSESCFVGKISSELAPHAVTTYLIPHSSDFSRFLVKWENSEDTGLVGIACVLNLLTGGLEMKRLGIAAQCVFLDYSGCAKHWHGTGIPSSLDISRLLSIVGAQKPRFFRPN